MTHVIQSGNWREARYTVWDWRGARDVVIQSGNWRRARDTVIHEECFFICELILLRRIYKCTVECTIQCNGKRLFTPEKAEVRLFGISRGIVNLNINFT